MKTTKQVSTGSPQEQTTRIELLKLVHRHDRPATDLIKRAGELEAYVKGEPAAPVEKSTGDGGQGQ